MKITNLIFLLAIVLGDILYITVGGLLIKSITSLLFVALGVVNLIYAIKHKTRHLKFSIFLTIGLTFAMLGDILLEIHFITGAGLFAVGHIFYFVAYCFISKVKWKDFIYVASIFVPSMLIILFLPCLDYEGLLMKMVCLIYALIISFMLGKSISNFVSNKTKLNLLIMIGSALFFFSDMMLLFAQFGVFDVQILYKLASVFCLATYYPAEFLLAHSNYAGVKANNNQ